jgi:hypothetical protein
MTFSQATRTSSLPRHSGAPSFCCLNSLLYTGGSGRLSGCRARHTASRMMRTTRERYVSRRTFEFKNTLYPKPTRTEVRATRKHATPMCSVCLPSHSTQSLLLRAGTPHHVAAACPPPSLRIPTFRSRRASVAWQTFFAAGTGTFPSPTSPQNSERSSA